MGTLDFKRLALGAAKNKYVLLVLALGLLLLLLPRTPASPAQAQAAAAPGQGDPLPASGIPMDTEAARLSAALRRVRGVGDAEVLLSEAGAVVVCAGADNAQTRLDVTSAVSAYTGLGSDKIIIISMNETGRQASK